MGLSEWKEEFDKVVEEINKVDITEPVDSVAKVIRHNTSSTKVTRLAVAYVADNYGFHISDIYGAM